MKKGLRFFAAFILAVLMTMQPAAVFADESDVFDVDEAGYLITEILRLIDTKYVGSDASVEKLYEAALKGISELLDVYSEYMPKSEYESFTQSFSGTIYGVGIRITAGDNFPIIYEVLRNTPAMRAGLLAGDLIVSINGVSLYGEELATATTLIQSAEAGPVVITVERNSELIDYTIEREIIVVPSVHMDTLENVGITLPDVSDKYRYVSIDSFTQGVSRQAEEVIKEMISQGVEGFILDLRNNSGGYLNEVITIAQMLVPSGPIIFTEGKTSEGNLSKKVYSSILLECPFDKIVVLVNNYTASASEVLASALQDSGIGVVVGSVTYGKGVVQTIYSMPSGGAIKLTTEEYFRRDGGKINGIGVIPDTTVEYTQYIGDVVDLSQNDDGSFVYADEIINLKRVLKTLGFAITEINSVFDQELADVLLGIQKEYHHSETGVVDKDFANFLNSMIIRFNVNNTIAINAAYAEFLK